MIYFIQDEKYQNTWELCLLYVVNGPWYTWIVFCAIAPNTTGARFVNETCDADLNPFMVRTGHAFTYKLSNSLIITFFYVLTAT